MKGDTSCVKIQHFKVKSKEQKCVLLSLRSQEISSRVNEAFQECLNASWYGELNETYYLKRRLCLKSASWSYPSSPKIQRWRPTVFPKMTEVVFPWRKWEASPVDSFTSMFKEDEGSLRGLIVGRTQDTSLHHWLTLYKCFSSWIHAHGSCCRDNSDPLNNAEPANSHCEASGFNKRALAVLQWEFRLLGTDCWQDYRCIFIRI